jgi:hypothetical protein
MNLKQGVGITGSILGTIAACLVIPHMAHNHQAFAGIVNCMLFGITMFANGWDIGRGPNEWED